MEHRNTQYHWRPPARSNTRQGFRSHTPTDSGVTPNGDPTPRRSFRRNLPQASDVEIGSMMDFTVAYHRPSESCQRWMCPSSDRIGESFSPSRVSSYIPRSEAPPSPRSINLPSLGFGSPYLPSPPTPSVSDLPPLFRFKVADLVRGREDNMGTSNVISNCSFVPDTAAIISPRSSVVDFLDYPTTVRAFQPLPWEKELLGASRRTDGFDLVVNSSNATIRNNLHPLPSPPVPSTPYNKTRSEFTHQSPCIKDYQGPKIDSRQPNMGFQGLPTNPVTGQPSATCRQPQLVPTGLEAIHRIIGQRKPGSSVFAPSGMVLNAQNGRNRTPNHNRTGNYRGEGTAGSNQNDNIPEDQSCCIFMVQIPSEATHYDILNAIHLRGTGRIFSSHVNPPDTKHPTKAAKIVFTTIAATQLILAQARSREGFKILGSRINVIYNRYRYHEHPSQYQSRVIRVTGPADVVNYESLKFFWEMSIRVDILDVKFVNMDAQDNAVMDWAFGSILAQSVAAKMAIEREDGLQRRNVKVEYRPDPCEWWASGAE